jgi:hypothetical protein
MNSTAAMVERNAEPFSEPDGRTTWAVREYVYEADRYFRQIVSWHPTREEAEAAIREWRP